MAQHRVKAHRRSAPGKKHGYVNVRGHLRKK